MKTLATLETGRLGLVPWAEEHGALLAELSCIPSVTRHIGPGRPWPPSQAEEVALRMVRHWESYGFGWRAAIEKAIGQPVGFMALNYVGEGTEGLDPSEYEIGWWVHPACWGRGFAGEGGRAIRDEAFTRLGAPSVVARIQPRNVSSINVASALGLRLDFATTGKFGEPVEVYRLQLHHWGRDAVDGNWTDRCCHERE